MRVPFHVLLGVLLVCLPSTGWRAAAQVPPSLDPGRAPTQYIHEHWQDEAGLPQNSVSTIVQTHDGYLWVGTQEGLARFNGVDFATFDRRNTPAFSGRDDVRVLLEDRRHRLWIGMMSGGLLGYEDGLFARYGPAEGLTAVSVSALAEDADGTLWVGTFDGGLFEGHDGRFRPVAVDRGLTNPFVTAVLVDSDGTLWVGTRDGLFRRQGDHFVPEGPPGFVQYLYLDRGGTLWVALRQGLFRRDGGAIQPFPGPPAMPPDDYVRVLYEDEAGSLWMGTNATGLFRYRDGRFERFASEEGLTHDNVRALYQDREGSLWIGTDGGGLNRLREGLFTPIGPPEGLSGEVVYALYEDADGIVWVGTEGGGLNRLEDGRITHYTTADGLSHNVVSSIYGDGRGTLWVGTFGGGLNRLRDGVFTHYTTADGLPHQNVSSLFVDAEGTLWAGTDGGVARIRDGHITTLSVADGLSSNLVTTVIVDRAGTLWVGTYDGGLNRYRDGVFTHFTTADGLGSNTVLDLYEDADGTLWVGTYRGGLNRLRDGHIDVIGVEDGLYDDSIFRILEDDQNTFWISSNRGIFRISLPEVEAYLDGTRETLTNQVFGKSDGLRSQEMNGGAQPIGWKSHDGRLWFASVEGVAVVDPGRPERQSPFPPVVIEAVRAGHGRPVAEGEALPPGTEKIEFQFAGLSFVKPGQTRYLYILEGNDAAWSEQTPGRTATYTNLAPGHYTFRVLARNADGRWSGEEATFSFTLKPFFYQTPLFYLFCLLGLLSLSYLAYRLRIGQLKNRQRELERTVAERTRDLLTAKEKIEAQANELKDLDRLKSRFFANISHEFRTPLTLMIGPLENALEGAYGPLTPVQREQMQVMLRNAQRLLRLINQLLDLSKLEAGKMQLRVRRRNVKPLLEGIVFSFQGYAGQKDIDLGIDAVETPPVYYDSDQLEKVFFNLLSNAVKFTPEGGRIRVVLSEERPGEGWPEGAVEVRVSDTGPGIPPEDLPYVFDRFHQVDTSNTREHEGTGIGLALVQELVRLHGGEVGVESTPGEGTTFIVRLPLGRAHLRPEDVSVDDPAEEFPPAEAPSGEVLPERPPSPVPAGAPPEPLHEAPLVLVVDDNPDLRAYIVSCLRGSYRVAEARDGVEGLEAARSLRPDLILADLMMPRLDGMGLCEAIKADETLRHIPIILLTAKASQDVLIEGLEKGADEYMAKPFNARELLARIRNLIQLRKQEAMLRAFNENLETIVQEQLDLILEERERYERELIEARDRAEASARLKTAILNNMSHEIRTPLAGILGYAQILSGEVGEQQQEFVDFIGQNGKRLMNTLNAILDLSRLEAEDLSLELQPVNVVDAARGTAALLMPLAREKGLALTVDAAVPEAVARTDRAGLDRILNNLVGNAIKFTDEGTVTIEVVPEGSEIRLCIRDTGRGISPEFVPHLFDAFKQESDGLVRSHEGSGLGLAITKRLVERMGGRIEVASVLGGGSAFTVWLPAEPAEDPAGADRHGPRAARPARRTGTGKEEGAAPL